MPLTRTLLVAPVATALATLAGVIPAWRATRSVPMDAVRPIVAEHGLTRPVRRIVVMAFANLRRVPGRTALGAVGLFIGVAALGLLLSINLAFHGTLIGTALGNFISVQVRGVDYVGVALAVVLGAFSVADVQLLNLKERAPELVTLRAAGWRESHLRRLVAVEGLGIGILGSVLGAAVGTSLASLVGAPAGRVALAAALAAVAGVTVALVASLIPASLIFRLAPPSVLAEE